VITYYTLFAVGIYCNNMIHCYYYLSYYCYYYYYYYYYYYCFL